MKNKDLGWIHGGAGLVIKKLAALETKTLLIVVAVLAARLVCSHAQSVLLASAAASLNVTAPTQSDALGGNQLPGGAGAGNTNTGTGVFMTASSQSSSTNSLWLQVQTTNTTVSLVIHPPWNVTDGVYDLFYTTNLASTSTWSCMTRCAPGQTNLTVTGLTGSHGFFMLGLTNDTDGDGMTDAYEKLVSHTDPNVFNLVILSQPQSQTNSAGASTIFSVTASGVPTTSYQWRFNGTNIACATNSFYTLNPVQPTNAGAYSVVVSNSGTNLISSNAVLTVTGPGMIFSAGDLNCIVGSPPKIIDATAVVANSTGCSSFNGCCLTVSLVTNAQPEDVLAINNQGTGANQIGITNNLVTYWGTNIATFSGGRGANALVVNITTNSTPLVTAAIMQALVRDIAYHYYPSTNDSLTNRTVQFVLSDCNGNTNFPVTKKISLDCPWSLDVMLVIDCSGSMRTNIPGSSANKSDAAKAAAISFVTDDMQFTNDQVGLVMFADVVINSAGLTNNPTSVINKINNLTNGDYTDIGDGIAIAQSDYPTNGVGSNTLAVMILLTDGFPNRPTLTNSMNATNWTIFQATQAKQSGTRLITIGLGTTGDFDPNFLTTLASSPDDFIYASSTTNLLPIYHSIGCSLCRPPAKQPPAVQIVSPTNNQLFVTSPLNILLTAATSGFSGTVTNVQFFNGTNLPGNVTVTSSNTWTLLWTDVVAGSYSLTVKASDDAGNTATNGVSITVNAMPVVYITQPTNAIPTNFQSFLQTTNVTLSARASDSDGSIAQVQFYYFTNLWGTVTNIGTNGLYNFTTNNLPPGFYPITATATDNRGAVGWSRIEIFKVISTNVPPAVAITFPTNGATFAAGCDLTITATATASTNAAITNVEFFANGVSLGNDPASPYSMTRCCWSSGTNQLVARATDNRGMSMVSDPVQIIVLGETPTADGFWDPYFGEATSQGYPGYVTAMTVHGTDLYVGLSDMMCLDASNHFNYQNRTKTIFSLAKWDGTNWTGVGVGDVACFDMIVPYAIAVEGTNIYLGGKAYNSVDTYLYKLIGTNWEYNLFIGCPSDEIYYGEVDALAVVDSDVYVGGNFARYDTNVVRDTNVEYLAKLDPVTSDLERVGDGLNGPVFALASVGNKLFAGGTFTNAGGNPNASYIAELDGNVWTNLGTGVGGLNSVGNPGAVYAMAACGSNLYVGGDFTTAGGNTNANGIAKWDGKQWTTLQGGLVEGGIYNNGSYYTGFVRTWPIPGMRVLSISVRGNTLFVGGEFNLASQGTGQTLVNYIAKVVWSEQSQTWTWTDLDGGVAGGNTLVTSTAIMEGQNPGSYDLFVGGDFNSIGTATIPTSGMARWSVGRPYPAGPPTVIITNPVSPAIIYNPYQTITTISNDVYIPPRISFETNFDHTTNISIIATAWCCTNILTVKLYTNDQLLASVPGSNTNGYIVVTKVWTNPPGGLYLLKAVAVDTNMVASKPSQPVLVEVKNPTNSITAVDDVYTIPANSPAVTFYVLTNDIPANGLKISQITKLHNYLGSATVSFGGAYIRYTPFPNVYGIDTIYYTVTNAAGALDTASVTINILPLPQVNIVSPWDGQRFTNPATSLVVTGWVASVNTDTNASVTNVTLNVIDANGLLSASQTPVNGGFSFNWMNSTSGFYTFVAVATDGNGYTNSSPAVTIALCNSNAPSHTVTAVISNLNSTVSSQCGLESETNPVIRDGLFDLQGQAADSIATNPVAYQVLLFQLDPDAGMTDGDPAIEYLGDIPFANLTPGPLNGQGYHNGRDVNGALGRLDLTGIPDGVYGIMLKVRGGPDETNALVQVQINSQLKIGQFSFSEQDLVLPVNGIPITITRTYNSQNPLSGDFGSCWTYAMNSMDVQLDEQRQDVQIGGNSLASFDQDGFVMPTDMSSLLPHTVSIRAGGNWDVTLTLPNGQRTTFAFTPYLGSTEGTARWTAPPGIHATLTPLVPGSDAISYYPLHWTSSDSSYGNAPFENQDFPGWILTTQPDGTQYKITRGPVNNVCFDPTGTPQYPGDGNFVNVQVYGPPKLTSIIQRSGNVINIGDNGITNYSGTNLTRSVKFDRDYAGRITAVYDPNSQLPSANSQLPSVRYIYDRDNDNLIQVLKLVDRNAGTYTTNQYHYDNPYFPHYITSIENGNGVPVARNYYDDSGKLIAVQDANGNLTRFIHNTTNNMEVVIDRLGHTNTYVYDTRGNVTAQTNALNQVTTMAYDSNNNKTNEVVYLNGQPYVTSSYVYNGYNLLLASTDPLGHTNGVTYDDFGNVLTSSDAKGNTIVNVYDPNNGNLISTTDALQNPTVNSYNYGLLTGSQDAIGTTTTNSYDSSGNLIGTATIAADGSTILSTNTFAYDVNGNRTNSIVWRQVGGSWVSAKTTFVYDAMNRVVQTIDPDGGTNTVVYDPTGKQLATIDKLGRTNSYAYDAQGRLFQTTYPDNTTESSTYDANGNRATSTDRLGRVTFYYYDALNRLTNTTYPDNTTNTTIYDGVGRVAQTIDARGTITAFAYNAAGQRLAVTNAVGTGVAATNYYGYDANGNQTTFTDGLGHTTTNFYDALNRQTNVSFADGTSQITVYDAAGRRIAQTDQASITTCFAYDGMGRLTSVTNALIQLTQYQYDEAGNEIAQIDALNRTNTFQYDSLGRRIQHSMPGGQTESFGYDLVGNLIRYTNFNQVVITNIYDSLNRLAARIYPNGTSNTFTYTLTGQRQTMKDDSGNYTYVYDSRDRLCTNSTPQGTLFYAYDANGNVTNITSSTASGTSVAYQYDALNRLANVVDARLTGTQNTAYHFDAVGNLQRMQYPNSVTNVYQYDALNRLTNLVWKTNGNTIASFAYTLGASGNRTALSETNHNANRGYVWSYDSLYRLTNETVTGTAPIGNIGYNYDFVGNRTTRTNIAIGLGLANQSFTFNTNDWLKTDAYDNNGNTLWSTNGTVQGPYSYDYENRLTNFNNGAVIIVYDADGNRVKKVANGVTNLYLVDTRNPSGYAQVLEEFSGTNLAKAYTYGLDLISQRTLNPQPSTNYFVFDGHGSTRMLTDKGGNFVNSFAYDAYGNLIASNAAPQTAYLYCCQQWDADLGSYYLRTRTYNPDTGRFPTADSYAGNNEDPLSLHKYLYCQDDSVDGSDPSGHAVYFVTRRLSIDYGKALCAYYGGNIGHAYLLFTMDNDPGGDRDPLTHGQRALTTFSWHPNSWNYANEPADGNAYNYKATAPGRVWERHPDDTHPSSYKTYFITADKTLQANLLKAINNWISSQPVGYERGDPIQDLSDPGNDISTYKARRQAPENGIYYNLNEQNCVWWATIMLVQNHVPIPPKVSNVIQGYEHGVGAAAQVLWDIRRADTYHYQSGFPPGMSFIPGGYNIGPLDFGLGF